MSDTAIATFLLYLGAASTTVCLVALATSRLYRVVPAFTLYLAFVATVTVLGVFTPTQQAYWRVYLITSVLDYLWELAVVAELAIQILAFLREARYRDRKLAGLITFVAITGTGILMALSVPFAHVDPQVKILLQVDLAFDVFRVLVFAGILVLAIILGMRWRQLPIKITSYLSLYAAVALAARAIEQYADRLHFSTLWFRFADRGPILAWSTIMLLISLQLLQLPKGDLTLLGSAPFGPWSRWLAKK